MKIIRAEHLGMCFGVRDAIALALGQAETEPLTILGDLVHNPIVVSELRDKGIAIAHEAGHVTTQTVMVTAHGASQRTLANTRARFVLNNPDLIRIAADKWGTHLELVKAGIPVIGVEFGYTDVPIAELKPDRLIGHMKDLPAAVESLMKSA